MIKKIREKKFVKDNLALFIGTLVLNIFGFLFHFYMGRRLGPEHYGALGAALSIIYLMTIPLNTIQTSIARFSSIFNINNEYGKIKYLFMRSFKKLLLFGIIFGLVFIFLTPFIARFLSMDALPLMLLSLFFIFGLLVPINRGVLQGIQDFNGLSVNLAVEGLIKFAVGVLFVLLGYGVNGAIGAIIASYIVVFFLGLLPLKKMLQEKPVKVNAQEVYGYSFPVLIMVLSLTLFYSVDILLVKHFFSESEAGYYSAISLMGKIIFFGSISISQVMFPKTAELHQEGKSSKGLLYKSLGIIALIVVPAIAAYFLIPGLIVGVLYGKEYLVIADLLGWFGVFIGLTCFVYMIAFYKLSINQKKFLWLLLCFNVLEIISIWFFHESLFQVIQMLTINMLLLFLVLITHTFVSKDDKIIHNNPGV